MRISNKSNLVPGQIYYYVTVVGMCHFNSIKVESAEYVGSIGDGMNDTSLEGMIVFDNEQDAQNLVDRQKVLLQPLIIV